MQEAIKITFGTKVIFLAHIKFFEKLFNCPTAIDDNNLASDVT